MRNFLLIGILCFHLAVSAYGQQLYVRNRPFTGEVLRESGDNQVKAADRLGIAASTIYRMGLAGREETEPPDGPDLS